MWIGCWIRFAPVLVKKRESFVASSLGMNWGRSIKATKPDTNVEPRDLRAVCSPSTTTLSAAPPHFGNIREGHGEGPRCCVMKTRI